MAVYFTTDQAMLLLKQLLAKDSLRTDYPINYSTADQFSVSYLPVDFEHIL